MNAIPAHFGSWLPTCVSNGMLPPRRPCQIRETGKLFLLNYCTETCQKSESCFAVAWFAPKYLQLGKEHCFVYCRRPLKTRSGGRGTAGGNEDRKLNINRKRPTPFPLLPTSLCQPWCAQGWGGCSWCQFPVDHRYLLPRHIAALYRLGPGSVHSPIQSGR